MRAGENVLCVAMNCGKTKGAHILDGDAVGKRIAKLYFNWRVERLAMVAVVEAADLC